MFRILLLAFLGIVLETLQSTLVDEMMGTLVNFYSDVVPQESTMINQVSLGTLHCRFLVLLVLLEILWDLPGVWVSASKTSSPFLYGMFSRYTALD